MRATSTPRDADELQSSDFNYCGVADAARYHTLQCYDILRAYQYENNHEQINIVATPTPRDADALRSPDFTDYGVAEAATNTKPFKSVKIN